MPKTSKAKPMGPTADQIAELATRGEDISAYFTNKFTLVRPAQPADVDLLKKRSSKPKSKR